MNTTIQLMYPTTARAAAGIPAQPARSGGRRITAPVKAEMSAAPAVRSAVPTAIRYTAPAVRSAAPTAIRYTAPVVRSAVQVLRSNDRRITVPAKAEMLQAPA